MAHLHSALYKGEFMVRWSLLFFFLFIDLIVIYLPSSPVHPFISSSQPLLPCKIFSSFIKLQWFNSLSSSLGWLPQPSRGHLYKSALLKRSQLPLRNGNKLVYVFPSVFPLLPKQDTFSSVLLVAIFNATHSLLPPFLLY